MLRCTLSLPKSVKSARILLFNSLSTNISARARADLESSVKTVLRNVNEPITGRSLYSIGAVQGLRVNVGVDGGCDVAIDLDLFVPGHPLEESIKLDCKNSILQQLPWVKEVDVNILKKKSRMNSASASSSALGSIDHIVAVSSCKGGVGKSTVAVNLALSLAKRGLKVGLLDADIYGPSLPLMLQAEDDAIVRRSNENPKMIYPLQGPYGIKMLSFGHVNPKSGAPGAGGQEAAVMRGPMASRVINQLIAATQWGDLNYLIVDMPPGTGDIQITLSQSMTLTGAVIVTTPHILSLVDAAKGVSMFQELKVPALAVVENMSYFLCEHGTKYFPFGKGGRELLLRGMDMLASLPTSTPSPPSMSSPSSSSPFSPSNNNDDSSEISSCSGAKKKQKMNSNKSRDASERLNSCPFHSFPISQILAGVGADGNKTAYEAAMLPSNDDPCINVQSQHGNKSDAAEITAKYNALADDVVTEILKLQLGAQMVSAFLHVL